MGRRTTTRDTEAYARATAAARRSREIAAREVAAAIGAQVEELIIEGDLMGGRAMVAMSLRSISEAEQRGDRSVLRAAVMSGAVAHGAWIAALDYRPPSEFGNGASGH